MTTPADEALAHKIMMVGVQCARDNTFYSGTTKECAQLIAAHVAAQAPSGLVEALEKIASHKKYMEMLTEKEYGKANHGEAVADTFVDWARDALAAHKAQPVADGGKLTQALDNLHGDVHDACYECAGMFGRENKLYKLLNQMDIDLHALLEAAKGSLEQLSEDKVAKASVADVRGMVEALEYYAKPDTHWKSGFMPKTFEATGADSGELARKALASARHAKINNESK